MKRHRQCIEIIIAWTNKLQNPLPLIRKYVCSMHVCFMYLRMCNHGHIHLTAPQIQMHLRNYDVYCKGDHSKLDNNPVTSVTRKEFRGCAFQCSVWAPLSQRCFGTHELPPWSFHPARYIAYLSYMFCWEKNCVCNDENCNFPIHSYVLLSSSQQVLFILSRLSHLIHCLSHFISYLLLCLTYTL